MLHVKKKIINLIEFASPMSYLNLVWFTKVTFLFENNIVNDYFIHIVNRFPIVESGSILAFSIIVLAK